MGGRGNGAARNSGTEFNEGKYKNINPEFDPNSDKKWDPHKWNCVRCAIAFEANMRGEDVEARPHEFGDPESGAKTHENAIAEAFGKKHDEWDVGANKRELVIKRISDMMEDFGPNSRAILFLAHKGGKHVVNVIANNGNPILVDAQAGKAGSLQSMLKNKEKDYKLIGKLDMSKSNIQTGDSFGIRVLGTRNHDVYGRITKVTDSSITVSASGSEYNIPIKNVEVNGRELRFRPKNSNAGWFGFVDLRKYYTRDDFKKKR